MDPENVPDAGDNSGAANARAENNLDLLSDPLKLADAQFDRQGIVDTLSSLPSSVRRRVKALRKLQLTATNLEADFYQKVHELECLFAKKFQPLMEKRAGIVGGSYEPTDEECDYPLVEDELAQELEQKVNLNDASGDNKPNDGDKEGEGKVTGVPQFWSTVWRNMDLLADMVQEHDEPIMHHLKDVQVKMSETPMAFTLVFTWSPNEWFSNAQLTKEYHLKCEPDKTNPFEFDGPEIVSCKGSTIDWKPGKNVTVKLLKKKQKHKSRGATRYVTKQVKADSFFNFFDPPAVPVTPEAEADMDDESRDALNADFEIGQVLRDRVIPRAVLYYTGEAHDDDDYDDDEDEDEMDDDDIEDEEFDTDDDGAGPGAGEGGNAAAAGGANKV
jgi:nucleosome assembly protein 1-like 1